MTSFTTSSLNSGEKLLRLRDNHLPFQTAPILAGPLSGRLRGRLSQVDRTDVDRRLVSVMAGSKGWF